MIVTRKTLDDLGSKMNDSAGSKISDFARKQMEKYGWTEYVFIYTCILWCI